jgi:hypothetical protein
MRLQKIITRNPAAYTRGGKFAPIVSRQQSQVGNLGLQGGRQRAIAFAFRTMARGAVRSIQIRAFHGLDQVLDFAVCVVFRLSLGGAGKSQQGKNETQQNHSAAIASHVAP